MDIKYVFKRNAVTQLAGEAREHVGDFVVCPKCWAEHQNLPRNLLVKDGNNVTSDIQPWRKILFLHKALISFH